MKNKILMHALATILFGSVLSGCQPDINLADIEPSVSTTMGIGLPIGELTASIGDFLGNGELSQYISVDDKGVLLFMDTFNIERNFYTVDLTQYLTNTNNKFALGTSSYAGVPVPAGTEIRLDFPVSIQLANINTLFSEERIDSMWIREASFTSNFSIVGLNLPYSDIKKLEIKLDKRFSRAAGTTIDVPLTGAGYGVDVPITIDEFTLNLIKDKSQKLGNDNVVNQVDFTFTFTIQPSAPLTIPSDALIDYNFKINFMEYHAVWGWFKESNQMRDIDTIYVKDRLPVWDLISEFSLPFSEPEIRLDITHSIGAPLRLRGNYLFVAEEDEYGQFAEQCYATFDGGKTFHRTLEYVYLDEPLETKKTTPITFDNSVSNGNIDEFFTIRPDVFAYSYQITVDNTAATLDYADHYRLTENTDIALTALIYLPLKFNEGVMIAYTDTFLHMDISGAQMDSLLAEAEAVEDVHVHHLGLVLEATNSIPFDVLGEFIFLDSLGQVIDISLTDAGNKILIAGPTEIEEGVVIKDGVTKISIELDQETYDKLTHTKDILFHAELGHNTGEVRVLDKSALKIRIALAADIEADFNMDALFNTNEEVAQ